MMNDRDKILYLSEPYLRELQTTVTGQRQDEHGLWYTFAQTIFYPQGGGQSADRGWINGFSVQDVQKKGDQDWHLLAGKLPPDVEMKLDWDFRYENMRQHTGQHILSAAFSRLYNLDTVSVHLGSENTLIELNTNTLTDEQMRSAEEQANGIIAQNLPVKQLWIFRKELSRYSLRREVKVEDDPIRIIQIGEHDCTGCGGIHVGYTAEIGLLKIIGTEKIRKHIRVQSKIGRSAYGYFTKLNDTSQQLCTMLSMELDDLPQRVRLLLEEQRELKRLVKTVSEKWLYAYAQELPSAGNMGFFMIADLSREQLNVLSSFWLERNNLPCFICSTGAEHSNFILRSPAGNKQTALGFLKQYGPALTLKGGGSPELVQGLIDRSSCDHPYLAALQQKLENYFQG